MPALKKNRKVNMDNLLFDKNSDKSTVFSTVEEQLTKHNFKIINKDESRPWGGFFVIEETQAPEFILTFFSAFKHC